MTLIIHLPAEIEHAVRERALAAGLDLDSFAAKVLTEEIAEAPEPARRISRDEFQERLQRIINLHPIAKHFVDDSRESIYAGRGE